ncbi:MAG: hypothetical protein HYX34_02770 [Actinobacteria bacterium]|nr:hypothetical protein [Actinomycetota bacterium]
MSAPDHDDPHDSADRTDRAFSRFLGAHIATDVERAVFWVIAGSASNDWTVGVVAREARVDHHEAEQALRRFTSAGILEAVDGQGGVPSRYRWRSEMRYLHDGGDPPGRTDPVCGMPVSANSPYVVPDVDGEDVAFCSVTCLVRWRSGR